MQTTTDVPTILATVLPIAVIALILAAHAVGSSGFPGNAPVEQIMAIGISIDLAAAGIALGVRAAVIAGRRRAPYDGPTGISAFAAVGVILAIVSLLGFVAFSLIAGIVNAADGADQRYMSWSAGMFWLGIPWAVGVFFSAAAFRPGRGIQNSVPALVALAVLLVIAAATAAAAVAYGAGLTE